MRGRGRSSSTISRTRLVMTSAQIDWALYARLRELFVRVTQAEQCLYVTILVDVSSSMCFGTPLQKVQLACQLACGLAYIALAEGDRLQVASFADDLRTPLGPMRGIAQFGRVLDHLRRTESGGPTDLNAAVTEYCRRRRHRGLVVVISDLLGAGDHRHAIRALAAQRDRVLLMQVLDDLDFGYGLQGYYRMRDSETGREVHTKVTPAVRRSLARRLEAYAEGVAAFARERGQGYIQVRTRDLYTEVLAQAQRMKLVRS